MKSRFGSIYASIRHCYGNSTFSENVIVVFILSVSKLLVLPDVLTCISKDGATPSAHTSYPDTDPPMQVNPLSISHVLEHPSPSSKFPSSHSRLPKLSPSPHISSQYFSGAGLSGSTVVLSLP